MTKREQLRLQRAERVCRELRYQIAEPAWRKNRADGERLADLLLHWMKIAKKDKYERP